MKLINSTSSKTFQGKEHIQMGLDLNNSSAIMNMLRNNIYTDPIASFVRETLSNAADAHSRINNTYDSIEIDITEELGNNLLTIKDYGASMNKEVIINIYSKMGKSDKSDSNNERGGWGLGCKSSLAYTDHFWIETNTIEDSVNIYRKWVQYIDISKIGAITLLEEENVACDNFKTGTKISIPFNKADLDKIVSSLNFYLTYIKTKYKVLNESILDRLELTKRFYNYEGKSWSVNVKKEYGAHQNADQLIVLYDIPYALNLKAFYSYLSNFNSELNFVVEKLRPHYLNKETNHDLFKSFLRVLPHFSFELNLPIGSVEVSASRETLQYTEKTCVELYKSLYIMFIEWYQFIRVNLVQHPSLINASINYEKFPDILKREVLDDLKWERYNVKFTGRQNVFKKGLSPLECKQYKLDTSYSSKSNKYEDVLKKFDSDIIYIGSKHYIICVENKQYKNYAKFIKHYLKTSAKDLTDQIYNIYVICVAQEDFDNLEDWIKHTIPVIYTSDLITNFNLSKPKHIAKSTESHLFKTLRFYKQRVRTRATGIHSFLMESTPLKEPTQNLYYLNQEDIVLLRDQYSTFIPDFYTCDKEAHTFINAFNNYLESKDININNIYYTPKLTRNFKHSNWINILDIIKKDYDIYKDKINDCIYQLFINYYIYNQKPIFITFKENEIKLQDSYYKYIFNQYRQSCDYLKINNELKSFVLFFNLKVNNMLSQLDKKHITNFEDYEIAEESQSNCREFFNICDNYLKELPFLETFRKSFGFYSWGEIETKEYLYYINVVEQDKNLTKKILEDKTPKINSEFLSLVNNLKAKHLVS